MTLQVGRSAVPSGFSQFPERDVHAVRSRNGCCGQHAFSALMSRILEDVLWTLELGVDSVRLDQVSNGPTDRMLGVR